MKFQPGDVVEDKIRGEATVRFADDNGDVYLEQWDAADYARIRFVVDESDLTLLFHHPSREEAESLRNLAAIAMELTCTGSAENFVPTLGRLGEACQQHRKASPDGD
jgi:hypothetical protein